VTHDVQEAAVLGDLIAILSDRPATVRARVEPDVPRQERRLGEEALERLQRELTTLLLGE